MIDDDHLLSIMVGLYMMRLIVFDLDLEEIQHVVVDVVDVVVDAAVVDMVRRV
jgi:hypothetical protein